MTDSYVASLLPKSDETQDTKEPITGSRRQLGMYGSGLFTVIVLACVMGVYKTVHTKHATSNHSDAAGKNVYLLSVSVARLLSSIVVMLGA